MPLGHIIGAIGNIAGGFMQKKAAEKNIQLQREFAQQGIRWKVEDAKKAGIHPLAALGAQTIGFSPVSVGDMGLSAAGQDISRAVNAMRTPDEKVTAYEQALRALQLQRGQLENSILASKLRTLNQPGNPPGLPGERVEDPQRTRTIRTPDGLVVTDGYSDAQAYQNRYGDIVENLYGLRNWGREVLQPWVQELNRRTDRELGSSPWWRR